MRKIKAYCGIGYFGAEHNDIMEIDEETTEDEIADKVWDWGQQFLETWWEELEEMEDE